MAEGRTLSLWAVDRETGKIVWSCSGMTTNTIPTPNYRDGTAYLMSGFRGANLQAVKLQGASGELEAKRTGHSGGVLFRT